MAEHRQTLVETRLSHEKSKDHKSTIEKLKAAQKRIEQLKKEVEAKAHGKRAYAATPKPPSGKCTDWIKAAGVKDVVNAHALIMRESGCNPNATNPSSGACGLGQQLPCGKWPHAWNDPIGGIKDMQAYVFARYGSWAAANSFQQSRGWY